ncbi:hypothetical protein C7E12_23275, partial [Stenotrophomonas maltophilia]
AIIVLTAVVIGFGIDVRSVGDMGQLPTACRTFLAAGGDHRAHRRGHRLRHRCTQRGRHGPAADSLPYVP